MIETVYALVEKPQAFLRLVPERILFPTALSLGPLKSGFVRKNVS